MKPPSQDWSHRTAYLLGNALLGADPQVSFWSKPLWKDANVEVWQGTLAAIAIGTVAIAWAGIWNEVGRQSAKKLFGWQ